MLPLLVGSGRLNIALVLLGIVPVWISAKPVPMDKDRIEDLTNQLLQNGLPGLVSRWNQHDRAPAFAPQSYHAADPNVYDQANHFGDPHSAFGMHGTDWSNDGPVPDYMKEWESLLRPADQATANHHQGASSSQWQPEDIASASSNLALAPNPAHRYQAQAVPSHLWLHGAEDEFLQKNLANIRQGAQRRVTGAQQEDVADRNVYQQATAIDHQGASFSQWQPEDIASASSNLALAPDSAHRSQAQASLAHQNSGQAGGQFHEHLASTNARVNLRARFKQQMRPKRIAGKGEAAERNRLQLANTQEVRDDGVDKFFRGNSKKGSGPHEFFTKGTPEQQNWILKRVHELSRRGHHRRSSWKNGNQYMADLNSRKDVDAVRRSFQEATTNKDGPFQRYIIGDKVVLFTKKRSLHTSTESLVHVFALPIDRQATDPIPNELSIQFIGALGIPAKGAQNSAKQANRPRLG